MPDVVVITGSGSGMGRLAVRSPALARRAHRLYASMRAIDGRNRDRADEVRGFAREHDVELRPLEQIV